MKRCPRCNQTYTDNELNFCLNDGEFLAYVNDPSYAPPTGYADDAPPTIMMNQPRVTNQTNLPTGGPPAQWQNQAPTYQNQPYGITGYGQKLDQTLPTISLVLGIGSVIMVCCAGGLWLGLPAAIVGYLGIKNTEKDPARYGGRGMAVGGMVIGIIAFFASLLFLIFGSLS